MYGCIKASYAKQKSPKSRFKLCLILDKYILYFTKLGIEIRINKIMKGTDIYLTQYL